MGTKQGIGFFERYLTIWVMLCIMVGIAIGQWLPVIPRVLSRLEYANVSIPVAVLIWLMIYPMMLKVDFRSVRDVGKRPKGIVITCELVDQAIHDVWYCLFILLRGVPDADSGGVG